MRCKESYFKQDILIYDDRQKGSNTTTIKLSSFDGHVEAKSFISNGVNTSSAKTEITGNNIKFNNSGNLSNGIIDGTELSIKPYVKISNKLDVNETCTIKGDLKTGEIIYFGNKINTFC